MLALVARFAGHSGAHFECVVFSRCSWVNSPSGSLGIAVPEICDQIFRLVMIDRLTAFAATMDAEVVGDRLRHVFA